MITSLQCEKCQARLNGCFSAISREDLQELDRVKISVVYKKGQAIFQEGMEPTGIYCLNKGKVKISKYGIDGKEQILRFVTDGGLLEVRALLGGRRYYTTSTTLESSIVCYINKSSFFRLQVNNPVISAYLINMLSQLLEEADTMIASLAQKCVRERVAESLLMLYKIFSYDFAIVHRPNEVPVINLSREDLSNIAGTATETVVRALTELKHENLIDLKGRKILLLNIEGLKKVAKVFPQ